MIEPGEPELPGELFLNRYYYHSYDRIVASAIKIVLNAIFEKQNGLDKLPKERYFHTFSHGFRPNRGCHSALDVTVTWGLIPLAYKSGYKEML